MKRTDAKTQRRQEAFDQLSWRWCPGPRARAHGDTETEPSRGRDRRPAPCSEGQRFGSRQRESNHRRPHCVLAPWRLGVHLAQGRCASRPANRHSVEPSPPRVGGGTLCPSVPPPSWFTPPAPARESDEAGRYCLRGDKPAAHPGALRPPGAGSGRGSTAGWSRWFATSTASPSTISTRPTPIFDIDVAREQALLARPRRDRAAAPVLLVLDPGDPQGVAGPGARARLGLRRASGTALQGKILLSAVTTGGGEAAYRPRRATTASRSASCWRRSSRPRALCGMDFLPPFVVHGTHSLGDGGHSTATPRTTGGCSSRCATAASTSQRRARLERAQRRPRRRASGTA